jgi:hypothetical protein
LEWLHEGGESCFGRFFSLIFFVEFLLRSGSNRFFLLWRRDPVLELQFLLLLSLVI